MLDDLARRFAVGRICVVADRGLISAANVAAVAAAGVRPRARDQAAPRPHHRAGPRAINDDTDWVEVHKHGCKAADIILGEV